MDLKAVFTTKNVVSGLIAALLITVLLAAMLVVIVLFTGKNFTISKEHWFQLTDSKTEEVDSLKKKLTESVETLAAAKQTAEQIRKASIAVQDLPARYRNKNPGDVLSEIQDLVGRDDGLSQDVRFCMFAVQRELESSSGGVIVLRKNISPSLLTCIQRLLVQTGDLDTDYDESKDPRLTRAAVEHFQSRHGIGIDGRIGKKETWPILLRILQAGA